MSNTTNHFHAKSHAKWILAGEHAVLRGSPALVFPIPNKFIELFYRQETAALEVDFNGPCGDAFLVLFWSVFEESLKLLNKKHSDILGRMFFRNNIPMGAGIGFSAAFCVSLTKFFQWKKWISENDAFEFARRLENHFHGKSSGVDIAGSLYDCGMVFQMQEKAYLRPINLNWRPNLFLSYSGHVSVTSKCINLVQELWSSDPIKAEKIDQKMIQSVQLAQEALLASTFSENFSGHLSEPLMKLQKAVQFSKSCFAEWGLINPALSAHLADLKKHGALAFKPTGAGDGGYVLSLWDKIPDLPFETIAVF